MHLGQRIFKVFFLEPLLKHVGLYCIKILFYRTSQISSICLLFEFCISPSKGLTVFLVNPSRYCDAPASLLPRRTRSFQDRIPMRSEGATKCRF